MNIIKYFVVKPVLIYVIGWFFFNSDIQAALIVLLTGLLCGILEVYLNNKEFIYRTSRKVEFDKVIKTVSVYLDRDFYVTKTTESGIEGKVVYKGIPNYFTVKLLDNELRARVETMVPFPASIINWLLIHYEISDQLQYEGLYRA